jgi:phage N-6-adenine-methyltransferase
MTLDLKQIIEIQPVGEATQKIKKKRLPKEPKVRVQKESDERYTPEYVLDIIREIGPIVLDPCTTSDNRTGATTFYTFEDDGLTKDWWDASQGGLIYVNPPFSNLRGWVNKFAEEAAKGCNIVALTPGDTSTLWFQNTVCVTASAVCFWKGRIEFIRVSKAFGQGAMQPTMFHFWGPKVELFEKAFKKHGIVLSRINDRLSL